MADRFISKKRLVFAIPGRPIGRGNIEGEQLPTDTPNHKNKGTQIFAYKNYVKIAAKAAMREQGWELVPGTQPIYIGIVIYLGPGDNNKYTFRRMIKERAIPNRSPFCHSVLCHIIASLKGIVFEKERQIASTVVTKVYTTGSQGVEVVIGVPENMKELLSDTRNL